MPRSPFRSDEQAHRQKLRTASRVKKVESKRLGESKEKDFEQA
jgi:hypothetical protein